jgi:hypothetical protein
VISKVFPHFGLIHFFIAFFFIILKSSEVHINCISHSLMIWIIRVWLAICHNTIFLMLDQILPVLETDRSQSRENYPNILSL